MSVWFEQLLEAVKQLYPNNGLIFNVAIWDECMEIREEQQALVLQPQITNNENQNSTLHGDKASKTLASLGSIRLELKSNLC